MAPRLVRELFAAKAVNPDRAWGHANINQTNEEFCLTLCQTKEGKEVMDNAEGQWWSFCVKPTDLVILERKSIPQHLASLESLDKPMSITSLLSDLEDAGEARVMFAVVVFGFILFASLS